jgi:hypothetical protein
MNAVYRLFTTVLALLVLLPLGAQVVADDFSDGDFTSNPVWTGTSDQFVVNASNRVQLNATVAGQSYLSTSFSETSLDDTEWVFFIKQAFAGSANNLTRFYLSSQTDNLSYTGSTAAGANGYFLRFGETGSEDAIRLFRDDAAGSSPVEIAVGTPALIASAFEISVRVTRDAVGNFQIFADPTGGNNWQFQGAGTDLTYTTSTHLGWVCTYTASNIAAFQFDDVYFGAPVVDGVAPELSNVLLTGSNTLTLTFSEAIDPNSAANVANYSVNNGVGSPSTATVNPENVAQVFLSFGADFPGDMLLTLITSNVEDLAGNPMVPSANTFTYNLSSPLLFDPFTDGDFSVNPTWTGATSNFIVNADLRLQLNATVAGQSVLATSFQPGVLNDKEWRFLIKHTFAGSTSNFSRVYLSAMSSNISFTGSTSAGVEGYFLLFGETGSDDAIRLMRDNGAGSAATEIAVGNLGLVANAFEIRVKVLRDAAGNWQVLADPTGGSNYQIQATGFDNTYETTTAFGVACTYTASNVAGFEFDDVYFGPVVPDTEAPLLLSAQATGANTLDLFFNEFLDETTAEIATNYTVSGGIGTPVSALLDENNATLVHLTFANAFPGNQTLTVTATGVEDLVGNALISGQAEFAYLVTSLPSPGDVVINEMMVDPTPVLGLPEAEFIELFNASDLAFNLNGWMLVNSTTSRTLPEHLLLPGGYVILCNSTEAALFEGYGDVVGVNSWVSLTNTADSLTLISAESSIIDIVSYNTAWYGNPALSNGGITLERKNPFTLCSGAFNWSAAEGFQGGTPAAQNTVFDPSPDLTPPSLLGFTYIGNNAVQLTFGEPLAADAADNVDVLLTPGLGEQLVLLTTNRESLYIQFEFDFELAQSYLLTVSGISDCSGNALLNPIELELIRGFEPEAGELIINEIMAAPLATIPSPDVEYVEIFNVGDRLLDLGSLTLESGFIPQQALIGPGEYAVLTNSADVGAFSNIPNVVGMTGFPTLTNSGRTLTLIAGNTVLDVVTYSDTWYQDTERDGGGYSLERINPEHPCSDIDNWRASQAADGHTAGAVNSVFSTTPDNAAPGLLYVLVSSPNSIDLYFDKQLDPISPDNLSIEVGIDNGQGGFTNLNYVVAQAYMLNAENRTIQVLFSGGFSAGVVYLCRVSQISDCWGNTVGSDQPLTGRFAVPEPHEAGDLIINEILFNPFADGGVDFVEIYNNSSKNISIEGWQLANETDGVASNFRSLSEIPFVLYPQEYLVLTSSKQGVVPFYPNVPAGRIFEMESLPTYNNGDGVVVLADQTFEVSDRVPYIEDMHYPLLRDVKGVSLERLDFNRASTDATNWHSAAEPVGFATPGYENSQSAFALSGGFLSVTPEVFSPDNDGFDDNCLIAYTLPREGFTGNVTIYDDLGRRVNRLVVSSLLGTEGSFSWDGFDEQQLKAGIGIYIIYFEAFHPDGEVLSEKATTVLGHSLD